MTEKVPSETRIVFHSVTQEEVVDSFHDEKIGWSAEDTEEITNNFTFLKENGEDIKYTEIQEILARFKKLKEQIFEFEKCLKTIGWLK